MASTPHAAQSSPFATDSSIIERLQAQSRFTQAQTRIAACAQCPLRLYNHPRQPVPMHGQPHSALALIQSHPSAFDAMAQQPAAGRIRSILDLLLPKIAGITLARTALINAQACLPHKAYPNEEALIACTTNLYRQIEASGAGVILICGPDALSQFTSTPFAKARSKFWEGAAGNLYLTTVCLHEVAGSSDARQVFERDLDLCGELLMLKFVCQAAQLFKAGKDYSGLVDQQVADLTDELKAKHKQKYLNLSAKHIAQSQIAKAQMQAGDQQQKLF